MRNRIVSIAFLSALLIVSKEVLSFLPNIEIVTLLLMVYTYTLGLKDSLSVSFIFTLIQSILYPPHMWVFTYLIIWPLLILITSFAKKKNVSTLTLAVLSGLFGLSFGFINTLVSIPYFGINTFYSIWMMGLPWDLVHGVSNYFIVLLLFEPLLKSFSKVIKNP